MDMKVFVGVTSDYYLVNGKKFIKIDKTILSWLKKGGFIPIVLPPFPGIENEYLKIVDCVLIPGGRDIHPKFYGSTIKEYHEDFCDDERTSFEWTLIRKCAKESIPLLGICLGCQMINVAFGGTLIDHLNDPKGHHRDKETKKSVLHRIYLRNNSFLKNYVDLKNLWVSSSHHQAIKELAPAFYSTAFGPDNVIEVIESNDYPYIKGVQWHPERTPNSKVSKGILKWFREKTIEKKERLS